MLDVRDYLSIDQDQAKEELIKSLNHLLNCHLEGLWSKVGSLPQSTLSSNQNEILNVIWTPIYL